jgi:hypothetical protein
LRAVPVGRVAAAPGVKEGVTEMDGVFEDVGVLLGVPVFVWVGVGVLEKEDVVVVEDVGVFVDESEEPGEGVVEPDAVGDGDDEGDRRRQEVSVTKPFAPVGDAPPAKESVAGSYDANAVLTKLLPPPPPLG